MAGGPAGDLYLNIEVAPHSQFERDGDHLRVVVPVDIYTAATGGEARVPTLEGAVMLKIPPRTQADRVFRVKGKGMPRLEKLAERGDLYARAKLILPESLSDSELETLRQLAQARRR
jgi:curved DNA-binding protein